MAGTEAHWQDNQSGWVLSPDYFAQETNAIQDRGSKNESEKMADFSDGVCAGCVADSPPSTLDSHAVIRQSSHVANFDAENEFATCDKSPLIETPEKRLAGRELAKWAIATYTVDPIKNSKNQWRIRLRCRKTGCQHSDHLKPYTVSFMADEAFRQISRGKKSYEKWKRSIKAESAGALRKSDRTGSDSCGVTGNQNADSGRNR